MESTNNKLNPIQRSFLNNLRNHMRCPIYIYGSVQRDDYMNGKSDIDICMFTDNMNLTLMKLCNYLRVERRSFQQIVWKLPSNNKILHGYKMKYDLDHHIGPIEISIHNMKDREFIIEDKKGKLILPWYASWSLFIIKWVHYNTFVISADMYKYLKKKILSDMIPNQLFIKLSDS